MFDTAETFYRDCLVLPAERAVTLCGKLDDVKAMTNAGKQPVVTSQRAYVMMSHSRWIVTCPFVDPKMGRSCGGAQCASITDPRFFCLTCHNAAINGAFVMVEWPDEAMRAEIEAILTPVEDITCRNWWPYESIAELREQAARWIEMHKALSVVNYPRSKRKK